VSVYLKLFADAAYLQNGCEINMVNLFFIIGVHDLSAALFV